MVLEYTILHITFSLKQPHPTRVSFSVLAIAHLCQILLRKYSSILITYEYKHVAGVRQSTPEFVNVKVCGQ